MATLRSSASGQVRCGWAGQPCRSGQVKVQVRVVDTRALLTRLLG